MWRRPKDAPGPLSKLSRQLPTPVAVTEDKGPKDKHIRRQTHTIIWAKSFFPHLITFIF